MSQWIRFEDQKPEPGQEIFIAWHNVKIYPEFRILTEIQLLKDWSGMLWMPVPPYIDLPSPP